MFIKCPSIVIVEQVHIIFDMNKLRMTDADMWVIPEGWGLGVCVCVWWERGVGGEVKSSSGSRNGIYYWDYRTTSSPSQMIANLDWDPRWHEKNEHPTIDYLQNHLWTQCHPCVSISAPINTEYQRPHHSIYASVS